MELKLILAGLGGQGVIFITRLLSQTAIILEQTVMVSETHGMSQRGGSVVSHLKIGSNQAPLIRRGTADILLGLEPDEVIRNLHFIRRGGQVFVNSEEDLRPEVGDHLERLEVQVYIVPASRMAVDLGSAAVANVVLVGYAAAAQSFPFSLEILQDAVKVVARRGLELNLLALEVGFQAGHADLEKTSSISAVESA
jgi:indolepyruvate ferredoxin oxidoreductase beta subunit